MFKTWLVYSVTLIGAVVFFLVYKMWASWIILVLLLLLPVFALIMCLLSTFTMKLDIKAPNNAIAGTDTDLSIKVDGFASAFSFCRFDILFSDRMAGETKKLRYVIHDTGVTKIPVDTKHCGSYTYKITKMRIYDVFGFFHTVKRINKDCEFLIRPQPSIPEVMPDMFGFKAKNLRKSKATGSDIYDIRDYQPGDPVKTIHWKMSAKKDKLLVKEPLEEYGGHSRLLMRLTHDRDQVDLHLGQIIFTSRYFIEHEVSHKIRIIPPNSREVSFDVESETDLAKAVTAILRMRIPDEDEVEEIMPEEVSHED